MRWMTITRTNSGHYNGAMWIDADKVLAMQRVCDARGTYTMLFTSVPESHAEGGQAPGGFAGFDVCETPEDIVVMLASDPAPEQLPPGSSVPVRATRATARRAAGADAPNFDTP